MDPDVPLVVPEVNADTLGLHHGIVANPNCVAVTLSIDARTAAAGLRPGFRRQPTRQPPEPASASPRARPADPRRRGNRADRERVPAWPPRQRGAGWVGDGSDDTEEEVKVMAETRRVLDEPGLRVSVTTVPRSPMQRSVAGAAVWAELDAGPQAAATCARCCSRHARGSSWSTTPRRWRYPTPRWSRRQRRCPGRAGSAATPDVTTGSRCSSAPTTSCAGRRDQRGAGHRKLLLGARLTAVPSLRRPETSSRARRREQSPPMVATTAEGPRAPRDGCAECTACPLHLTRIQACPGYGPVTARVMAVR